MKIWLSSSMGGDGSDTMGRQAQTGRDHDRDHRGALAMTFARVSIQTEDFDVSTELAALRAGDGRVGAVCSFVGTVRENTLQLAAP